MKKFASLFGNNWIPLLVGVVAYFVTDHVKIQAFEAWKMEEVKYQEKQDKVIDELRNVASKLEATITSQESLIKLLVEERKTK